MKLDFNDPRITAYALGELDNGEREIVERARKEDARIDAEIREIQQFVSLLSGELAKEPLSSPVKTETVAARPRRLSWMSLTFGTGFATAAVGLLVFLNLKQQIPEGIEQVIRGVEPKIKKLIPADGVSDESSAPVAALPQGGAQPVKKVPPPQAPKYNDSLGGASMPREVDRGVVARGQLAPATNGRPSERSAMESEAAPQFQTENYSRFEDNPFIGVGQDPRSTFSIDVDTASYANLRRFLVGGALPPKDAVRIEEMINYFSYDYPQPKDNHPFSVNVETSEAPWNREHRLVKIGLKGKEIPWDKRPATNLVFLIDVSGSMNDANKLPLVKESLDLLIEKLEARDRVAIVVYAGAAGLVLPSTKGSEKTAIREAIQRLSAGGSTNGGQGIELAYKTAKDHFIKGGINRVIIATDGDFNVGTSSEGDLTRLIEEKAKSGVFLSVLGYGMGNYKDSNLEKLADKGNGNYAYVDNSKEARKVMSKEIMGTLFTIAKDVKLQVEFNPAKVGAYRLIGYENRVLAHQDFNDDKKDAGDIGSGHTVTALYEVVPVGKKLDIPGVDALKYQSENKLTGASESGELMTLKLRYKKPDGDKSELISTTVKDAGGALSSASQDFKFAAAVASFGMILRDSKFKGKSSLDEVLDLAAANKGADVEGYRAELVDLVRKAKALKK